MRTLGIVLSILGGMSIIGSLNNAVKMYNLSDPHDQSKFFGGLAFALILLGVGLWLIRRGKPTTPTPPFYPQGQFPSAPGGNGPPPQYGMPPPGFDPPPASASTGVRERPPTTPPPLPPAAQTSTKADDQAMK